VRGLAPGSVAGATRSSMTPVFDGGVTKALRDSVGAGVSVTAVVSLDAVTMAGWSAGTIAWLAQENKIWPASTKSP